jgi:uncharacterized membrane protein
MKKCLLGLLTAGVFVLVGCEEGKSPPGGPGATGQRSTGVRFGEADNTFRLDVPNLETGIKQGESKTVSIGINRGKNFDQDVRLSFGDAPKGVKVTPASSMLKHGDKEVQVTLEAANDAALGEHMITVTGTPAREGAATSAQFKIEVKKP